MTIPLLAVLGPTALWHAAAGWHFLLYPERTLRRTTSERPVNVFAIELFRFLGALNAGLVVFALLLVLLPRGSAWIALVGFSLLNLSQFAIDLRVRRLRLATGPMFLAILWGDLFFCVLNGAAAIATSMAA